MSGYNGSGVFVISGVGLPVVTGTTISSTVENQLNTDIATGLSNCLTKDGQTTPTANIPLGGFKLTGIGVATTTGDALSYGQAGTMTALTLTDVLTATGAVLTSPTLASPTISSGALSFSTQGNIRYASATEGQVAVTINGSDTGNNQHFFYDFAANSANNTTTCYYLGQHSGTGRSINAGGTINASGADYAEYETKAPGCGPIAKGQIIGFDANGHITDKWADAVSFGIKSTDPSYVGGDTWGNNAALGERPLPPDLPEMDPQKPGYDAAKISAYPAAITTYEAACAEYSAHLETARQKVDRIAYSGKVPVNVSGAAVGDYVVATQDGDSIAGRAVPDPTFAQYRAAVGRVRKLLEGGRCIVAVLVH